MKHEHLIKEVEEDGIAAELGIEPGDTLLSIDGEEIVDIFDYRFRIRTENLTLLVRAKQGGEYEFEIEKDEDDDLGLVFESGLMDEYRSCSNKCIFCFIDQMPPGMRETLYFKDDDARLSFLQGNYVTLTNMKDEDLERIIRYRLQPINISVHTTDPGLRCMMLSNRFAGKALDKIKRLNEAGITMNGQIVLCKGINDGKNLEKSIDDLAAYIPNMQSLSVVPVGLTKFRDSLYPLKPFEKEDAIEVLDIIHTAQRRIFDRHGINFVHAGDEWYLLAEMPLPEASNYDGFLQLENGVGMMRLLYDEFADALKEEEGDVNLSGSCSIACGMAVGSFMNRLCGMFMEKFPGISVNVYPVRNDFFGGRITVSGLLTGRDIIAQLKDADLGEGLIITRNMLRYGEDVFLDDLHVNDIEKALGVKIIVSDSGGAAFIDTLKQAVI
ncbi:MAG: DUF512 domain-containing protein [Lachnospiraceae bacterium]|nr:DUF512 domain-containing protein [Lachnospiraceae bacterium]